MEQYSDIELAADYKQRGIERIASYSQYVKDRNLKPTLNAKEFYEIYDWVQPCALKRQIQYQKVEGMTHLLKETYMTEPKEIKILEDHATHIRFITSIGMTGGVPRQYIEYLKPYTN